MVHIGLFQRVQATPYARQEPVRHTSFTDSLHHNHQDAVCTACRGKVRDCLEDIGRSLPRNSHRHCGTNSVRKVFVGTCLLARGIPGLYRIPKQRSRKQIPLSG